jgi:hypothetical protein
MKNQLLAVVATLLVASVSAASFKKLDSCDQDTSYKFASTRTSYNLVGNSTSFDDYIKFGNLPVYTSPDEYFLCHFIIIFFIFIF